MPVIQLLHPVARSLLEESCRWTTVTCCSMASMTTCFGDCSRFRMRLHVFLRGPADATTSHQSFVVCTGCPWSSELTTSWLPSCTSRCVVKRHRTWSTTASRSPTPDAASSARLMPTRSVFRGHAVDSATGVSRSRVQESGTVCMFRCDSRTLNSDSSSDF